MKDYIIWLKSGECIQGTAKEDILIMLKERFKDCKDRKEIISFPDTDGEVLVDLDAIDALSTMNTNNKAQIGIKGE